MRKPNKDLKEIAKAENINYFSKENIEILEELKKSLSIYLDRIKRVMIKSKQDIRVITKELRNIDSEIKYIKQIMN